MRNKKLKGIIQAMKIVVKTFAAELAVITLIAIPAAPNSFELILRIVYFILLTALAVYFEYDLRSTK